MPVLSDSLAVVGIPYRKSPGLRLFDLATGAARASFGPPTASGNWALTSDGLRAVCHIPGKIQVWDAATGALSASWDDDADDLALSPDGRLVTGTAGPGRTVSLYETASGRLVCRYVSASMDVRFAPDGRSLINWNAKFAVRVDVASGGSTIAPLSGTCFLNGTAVNERRRSIARRGLLRSNRAHL